MADDNTTFLQGHPGEADTAVARLASSLTSVQAHIKHIPGAALDDMIEWLAEFQDRIEQEQARRAP